VFVLVVGGGKVGYYLAKELIESGHEVALMEKDRARAAQIADEIGSIVISHDGCEGKYLAEAGCNRADVVAAVTGDDEDNLVICQLAQERYNVPKVIARVNDPRNQAHFDLLGIAPTVSAISSIMALVEHEVPEHGLIHLLELRHENLEIVEVLIGKNAPSAGKSVERLQLPEEAQLISVTRNGDSHIAVGSTVLEVGDRVLAILQPGSEEELRKALL